MKNNPLIDAAAILICLLAVIAVGHYMKSKKEQEVLQIPSKDKVVPTSPRPSLDVSRFETASKRTE